MYNFDNFEDEEKEKGIEYLNFKKIIEEIARRAKVRYAETDIIDGSPVK